jgi:hypothetical protein
VAVAAFTAAAAYLSPRVLHGQVRRATDRAGATPDAAAAGALEAGAAYRGQQRPSAACATVTVRSLGDAIELRAVARCWGSGSGTCAACSYTRASGGGGAGQGRGLLLPVDGLFGGAVAVRCVALRGEWWCWQQCCQRCCQSSACARRSSRQTRRPMGARRSREASARLELGRRQPTGAAWSLRGHGYGWSWGNTYR